MGWDVGIRVGEPDGKNVGTDSDGKNVGLKVFVIKKIFSNDGCI